MIDWLRHFWETVSWGQIVLGAVIIVASAAISFAAASFVMVRIPANYFHRDYDNQFLTGRHPLIRLIAIIAKNILGVLLIILGIILIVPGVPGPGFLTFFIGLILTDIPGKRALEARIIKRPTVFAAINKLRAKYDKPPLVID